MSAPPLYAGPGKVTFGSGLGAISLFPEGENGQIMATVNQEALDVSSAMHGRMLSLQGDATARITIAPLDSWGLLFFLFPAFIGAKVGATAAGLAIGTRPHNPIVAGSPQADLACKIWTPDGRLYTFSRTAITKHPDLHLGVDKALFGQVEITAIGSSTVAMGSSGFLVAITESGASDPGGAMSLTDFQRGEWTGAWGAAAGFGGDSGNPMEAEDEWVITSEVKYSPLKVQRLTRAYKLDSVKFMAKGRLYGPTQTQIDTQVGLNSALSLGKRLANTGSDLVLTNSSTSKTITLKNSAVVGEGFEFGGTKLGTGEVGFVNGMTFTSGAPNSLIEFST